MGFAKWRANGFEPDAMLLIFTIVNTLTYFDRGVLGAVLDNIEKDYHVDNTMGGLLASAYMLGYVTASPVFAHYAPLFNPLRMMAGGLLVWSFACMASGLTVEYYSLLFVRMLTGAGEASFLCLAPPFIDRYAPADKRSSWLAIFYLGLPMGYAFGAATAGEVAQSTDGSWGWRSVFVMEGILMLPFVLLCWVAKPDRYSFAKEDLTSNAHMDEPLLDPKPSPTHEESKNDSKYLHEQDINECDKLKHEISFLTKNKLYICIVLAYTAQTFVTGGFAVIGVKYLEKGLHYDQGFASTTFGAITAATGIFGTLFGGWILDKMRNKFPNDNDRSLQVAVGYSALMSLISLPCAVAAFALTTYHRGYVFIFLGITEFIVFACISPINAAIMWSVPFEYNPIAIAMSVVCTHVFGDGPSPAVIGAIQDHLTKDWTKTMIIASFWLIWSVVFFTLAYSIAAYKIKKRDRNKRSSQYMFNDNEDSNTYDNEDEEYPDIVYEPVSITKDNNTTTTNRLSIND